MARAKLHPIFSRLAGSIGDVVYRWYGDKLVVSRKPSFDGYVPSPAQRVQRRNLAASVPFARAAMADPELRAHYEAIAALEGGNRFSKAVGDFMTTPSINVVDISAYTGRAGDAILVDAEDKYGVAAVEVSIRDSATGDIVEEGVAEADGPRWRFIAREDVPPGTALTVSITALDRPGNRGEDVREVQT